MAPANVYWLDGENIIMEEYPSDFKPAQDAAECATRMTVALSRATAPVPCVTDLRLINVDFGDLTTALAELTRSPSSAYRHPNLKELCVVTDSALLKIGAKALKQDQYGAVKTRIFDTMDDALTYARSIAPAAAQA